ncbi:MAG: amidohydrolase family protein [Nitrospirae bacterium]|nr:amidohydrolase family protein [Nitrospirota bacterium]
MNGIVDFHTHAFPDKLAERAVQVLLEEGRKKYDVQAFLDGKVSSLLASMDRSNIEKSVICMIATKPSQFDPIFNWSKQISSDRIIPFPSLHPESQNAADLVRKISAEGFKGVKFHPYYQEFSIDEKRLFPIYEELQKQGLIVVMHTGFDLAFERQRKCDPKMILNVLDAFPDLKLVTTHLGAWEDWDEVEKHLSGRKIYMEISFSLDCMPKETARRIILNHPKDHILFGSDSPWADQGQAVSLLKGLELGQEMEDRILRKNALQLLETA